MKKTEYISFYADKKIEPEKQVQPNEKCILCGENAPYGPFCLDCYYEMLDIKDNFDKNQKAFQLKDYYFNLRSNIYRMKNFEYIQSNCKKLMALAVLLKELYDDEALTDRVVPDIIDIIKKKTEKEEKPSKKENSKTEKSKIEDARKEEIKRTMDGHYVKSDAEAVIDDTLYDLRIAHCYEKKVPIDTDEEQAITSDWFIPVLNIRKGIYIEYWGMNTKKYLENKERKIKQYKDHNIPFISIEKDDIKDRQSLSERLIKEINSLAKKYFKISDFIDP